MQSEVWRPGGVIRLTEFGSAHSVLGFLDADGQDVVAWYVNLEAPIRRSRFGFNTADHMLDLWVTRDFSSWRWKDEHELAEAVGRGLMSRMDAERIKAEGERTIQVLQAGGHVANQDPSRWYRDANWPLPVLPDDWEAVDSCDLDEPLR